MVSDVKGKAGNADLFGLDFVQKGSFEDGYQAGDGFHATAGTLADVGVSLGKGAGRLLEGLTDLALYGISAYEGFKSNQQTEWMRENVDYMNRKKLSSLDKETANKNTTDEALAWTDEYINENSFLGTTGSNIVEGVGQVGTIVATGGLAGAA